MKHRDLLCRETDRRRRHCTSVANPGATDSGRTLGDSGRLPEHAVVDAGPVARLLAKVFSRARRSPSMPTKVRLVTSERTAPFRPVSGKITRRRQRPDARVPEESTVNSTQAARASAAETEPLHFADVRRRVSAIFVGSIGNLVEWYDLRLLGLRALLRECLLPRQAATPSFSSRTPPSCLLLIRRAAHRRVALRHMADTHGRRNR